MFSNFIRIGRHWQLQLLNKESWNTEIVAHNERNLRYFYFVALFAHWAISCDKSTLCHLSYTVKPPIFSSCFYYIFISLCSKLQTISCYFVARWHIDTLEFPITPTIKDFYRVSIFLLVDTVINFIYVLQPKEITTTCTNFHHAVLCTTSGRPNCKDSGRIWVDLYF